jgi:hypothetical protein
LQSFIVKLDGLLEIQRLRDFSLRRKEYRPQRSGFPSQIAPGCQLPDAIGTAKTGPADWRDRARIADSVAFSFAVRDFV